MWDPWAQERASEQLRGRITWFLLGRVAIISCFLAVVALLYLQSGSTQYVLPVNHLLFIIVATYAFSVVSAITLERTHRLAAFTYIQIGFDILLITGVVYLTGGIGSPFPVLYSLPILNAAGLLLARGAAVSAICAAIAYDGMALAVGAGAISNVSPFAPKHFDLQLGVQFASTNLMFVLIAYLAGVLASRLHRMEVLLSQRQAERDRLALYQETLARTIGSGLLTTDPEGHITSANKTAETLAGLSSKEMIGADIGTIFPPLQLTASARLRFLQSSTTLEPAEFIRNVDGDDARHLRCVAASLKDTYHHPIGALYVLQDVTDLKRIEEERIPASRVEANYRTALETAAEVGDAVDGLYGVSPGMKQIRHLIERVSRSNTTVLITGESGTGKELVARALHAHSARHQRPFVAINCGAIPENLIESELFGHVRGAFTGAVSNRAGCFRAADSGSIFLDEIAELPLALQVKLLRVLQERVFRPVGSEANVAVDVRVIAASNRDLEIEIRNGRFREDLFYRVNVIRIALPPLRERRDDIPLLIRHFLRQFCDLHGRSVQRLTPAASARLLEYDYPGNIRELENIAEHIVALCEGETADEDCLPHYLLNGGSPRIRTVGMPPLSNSPTTDPGPANPRATAPIDLDRDLAEHERQALVHALDAAGGVKKRAAQLLGINYRSLRHRLQKYGLGDSPAND